MTRSKKADSAFPQFQDDFAYPPLPEVTEEPFQLEADNSPPVIGYLMIALVLVGVTIIGFTVFGGGK